MCALILQEQKVHILVLDFKPPFLDGRVVYTKQQDPVSVVKDPLSDMAVIARKGSNLLFEARHQKERTKMVKKFWELAGTKQGDLIGVKRTKESIAQDRDNVCPKKYLLYCSVGRNCFFSLRTQLRSELLKSNPFKAASFRVCALLTRHSDYGAKSGGK